MSATISPYRASLATGKQGDQAHSHYKSYKKDIMTDAAAQNSQNRHPTTPPWLTPTVSHQHAARQLSQNNTLAKDAQVNAGQHTLQRK